MDPNERKPRDGKRYEFPVHSERTRALAAAMDTAYAQGPPQGYTPSRSVFPASNAYAVEPIPYPSQMTAPPAHSRMDVDTQVSTEEERRWNREQERRSWQQYRPPSPQYQRPEFSRMQRPPSIERLRDDVVRSRAPHPLEGEVARLREENERLQSRLRLAEFDRQQRDQKMAFLEEQLETRVSKNYRRDDSRSSSYHPYPRPERSGYSRDSSPGPDRSKRSLRPSAGPRPVVGQSSASTAPAPSPNYPRINQSLDTAMADASRQVPPPPAVPVVSRPAASGTATAPAPTFEQDPYKWDEARGDDEYDSDDSAEFVRKEKLRQIRVENKAARDKKGTAPPEVSYDTSEELHGPWSGVAIETVEDWERLRDAAIGGDTFAVGYVAFLNTKYQRPGINRTPGISRLLRGYMTVASAQKDALKDYKAKTLALKKKAQASTTAPAITAPPGAPSMSRNPPQEGVDSSDYYISYSPPGNSLALPGSKIREFSSDTTNPGDPPQAVGRDWAVTPVARWPLGLRVSGTNGNPREPSAGELGGDPASPFLPDVEMLRWISELSPFRRRQDASTRNARRTWYNGCINLFSVPGLYAALIKRIGFPSGNRRRERFPFDTRNLDVFHIALWFHDHGLYPQHPELQEIERWARLVRGMDGDIMDSEGRWNTSPRSIATMLEGNPALAELSTTFQYPPRVPSAHARSWATAAERFVNERRVASGLSELRGDIAPKDESDDETMGDAVERSEPGPSRST